MQPLILTLALDAQSQNFFDEQREQYFPPERNHLKAHVSLFHQLPPDEPQIVSVIQEVCANQSILPLQINEVRNIGSGVAYKIDSPELVQLHQYLQRQWQQWLIPQDRHKLWPHITVQNKAEPAAAAALRTELAMHFEPFVIQGTGLILWEYLGGPWRYVETYSFEKQVG